MYAGDRIVYRSRKEMIDSRAKAWERECRELKERYDRDGGLYVERRDLFGYDDPYLPRGGGHQEGRVTYQAELGLEHQGYRRYQPRREPEQDGTGKIRVKIPSFDGNVDTCAYLEWEVKIE